MPARARPTRRPASLARSHDALQTATLAGLLPVLTLEDLDAAVLFQRMTQGEEAMEAKTHLLNLHDALRARSRPACELSQIFADEC